MVLELKIAVVIAVAALLCIPFLAGAAVVAPCVGAAPLLDLLRTVRTLLAFLIVSAVTMRHLGAIREFVFDILTFAGRSSRRVIALLLLLVFVAAFLYFADDIMGRLLGAAVLGIQSSQGGAVMTDVLLLLVQFLGAGGLLCLIVWLELRHAQELLPQRFHPWAHKLAHIAISVFAVALLVEPIIPGTAGLTITVPVHAPYPTLRENLRVRVAPVGIQGPAGGDRTVDAAFDNNGTVDVVSKIDPLETRVEVDVYDVTQPDQVLWHKLVWVSPFVRCQLLSKTITL
jgi:hypothetical protein